MVTEKKKGYSIMGAALERAGGDREKAAPIAMEIAGWRLEQIAKLQAERARVAAQREQLGWSPAQTDGTWDGLTVNGEIDGPALDEQLGKMKAELQDTGGAAGV